MKTKQRAYVLALVITLAGFCLFAVPDKNPTMRQPQIGAPVHPVTKRYLLRKNFAQAQQSAESLDRQVRKLIEASSMGTIQRWRSSVDLSKLESQYVQDIREHLEAMTVVMKLRRESKGLHKLQEFKFQNLLRQSDYLLALKLSSQRLHLLGPEVLEEYENERKLCETSQVASL